MWAAAGLAALFAGWRFWRLAGARVNVTAATKLLMNLVLIDNLGGARKVCAAAPRAVYLIAMRAALAAPDEPRAPFEDAFGRAMAPLEANRWMDLVALAAGLTAVLLAVTAVSVSMPVLLVGAAAAVAAILNVRSMRRLRGEVPAGFAKVVAALLSRKRSADRQSAESAPTVPMPPAGPELPPAEDGGPGVLHLTASLDGDVIASLALEREVVKIGKLASSHLCLDHPSVSRMHAVIETTVEGSTIIDLGSTSGVSINGERINKATIADGDEIRVGEVLVRVSSGPGAPVVSKPAPPPGPPAGAILDLRNGTCPLCRARTIARRPAVAGDLIPWVCEGCGYAQLFTAG